MSHYILCLSPSSLPLPPLSPPLPLPLSPPTLSLSLSLSPSLSLSLPQLVEDIMHQCESICSSCKIDLIVSAAIRGWALLLSIVPTHMTPAILTRSESLYTIFIVIIIIIIIILQSNSSIN